MKVSILRLSLICLAFFLTPLVVKADCSSAERLQINTQASYVTYNFSYNADGTFSVTFENLTSNLAIEYNGKMYLASKNGVTIDELKEGLVLRATVVASSQTNCPKEVARYITYRLPYYNKYLNSEQCELYPEIQVCKTKFFNYEMTPSLFKKMFESQRDEFTKEEGKPVEEEVMTWKDIMMEYLLKYGMQVTLFILGAGSTFILGHNALKRAKAKF